MAKRPSNEQLAKGYREVALVAKHASGKWLSKAEYEKKTGRPGRSGIPRLTSSNKKTRSGL